MGEYKGKANVKTVATKKRTAKVRGEHPYGSSNPTQASVVRDSGNADPMKLDAKAAIRDLGAENKAQSSPAPGSAPTGGNVKIFSNLDKYPKKDKNAGVLGSMAKGFVGFAMSQHKDWKAKK